MAASPAGLQSSSFITSPAGNIQNCLVLKEMNSLPEDLIFRFSTAPPFLLNPLRNHPSKPVKKRFFTLKSDDFSHFLNGTPISA